MAPVLLDTSAVYALADRPTRTTRPLCSGCAWWRNSGTSFSSAFAFDDDFARQGFRLLE
jgi:hypothetical protein